MTSTGFCGGGDAAASHRIQLSGALDLRNASALRERILEALKTGPTVSIDAREVTSIDAGIVQILLSARNSAERLGRGFVLVADQTGVIAETMQRLGVAPPPCEPSSRTDDDERRRPL